MIEPDDDIDLGEQRFVRFGHHDRQRSPGNRNKLGHFVTNTFFISAYECDTKISK